MKKGKLILLCVLCFLLAVILAALAVFCWYWPRYAMGKEAISIPSGDTSKVTLMSCNLRCLTPLDLGKKSWFYRADLITKDIENQAPVSSVSRKPPAGNTGTWWMCCPVTTA